MAARALPLLLLSLLLAGAAGAASRPPLYDRALAAIPTPSVSPETSAGAFLQQGGHIDLAERLDFDPGIPTPGAVLSPNAYRHRLGLGLSIGGTALLLGGAVVLHVDAANSDHWTHSGVRKERSDYHLIGSALVTAGLLLLIPGLLMLARRR